MKKVVIATGLAVLSTSAFATVPRINALGGNTHYIKDTMGLYKNASYINDFKNFALVEYVDGSGNSAIGAYAREMGNFAYGVILGNDSWKASDASGENGTFLDEDNSLDLFFGGDMGVKWGAMLHYSAVENKTAKDKTNVMGLNVGMQMGAIEAYANTTLSSKAEDGTNTVEGKLGLTFGGSYTMGNMTAYASYMMGGFEKETGAGATGAEQDDTTITVGVGHINEVASNARIFTDITFVSEVEEIKNGNKTTTTKLPLNIAFEADANSWLTLRGNVKQNVIIGGKEVKPNAGASTETYLANSTEVNAGATLNFGKLKVDGTLGLGTNGKLSAVDVMSNVAVHYWF